MYLFYLFQFQFKSTCIKGQHLINRVNCDTDMSDFFNRWFRHKYPYLSVNMLYFYLFKWVIGGKMYYDKELCKEACNLTKKQAKHDVNTSKPKSKSKRERKTKK